MIRNLFLLGTGIIACAIGIYVTNFPFGRAMLDFLFVLDGAYRMEVGQIPHVDFASPIGPLTLYITYAAERLFPEGNAFVGMHVVMWLMTLPAIAALAPRFRSNLEFFIATAVLAIIMLVPITVDRTDLAKLSYFATYNRFATGYLFLIGAWLVLPKSRHDWAFLGYVLLILFFLKVTTFVVAVGLLAYAVLFGRARLLPVLASILGFVAVTAGLNVLSGGVPMGYLSDIRGMSDVNSGGAVYALLYHGFRNWLPLLAAAALGLWVALAYWPASPTPRSLLVSGSDMLRRETFITDTLVLIAAAWLAESQNSGGLGLVAAIAVIFSPQIWQGAAPRIALMTALLAAIAVPVLDVAFNRVLTTVVRETKPMAEHHPVSELFPETSVSVATAAAGRLFTRLNAEWPDFIRQLEAEGYRIEKDPGSNASGGSAAWIASAVQAGQLFTERNYRDLAQNYATLAFADPFARMLDLTPALNTNIVRDIGRTITYVDREGAAEYLATADGVFFSKCERRIIDNNEEAFREFLDGDFEKLPLNECWDFYHRTSG